MKQDRLALGGAVLTAFVASLCCLGPLLAVLLGLGTFGAAAFESLRPWFLGLTAFSLAGAFYLTYRKRVHACEGNECKTQSAGRASKVILWIATLAVIALTTFPYYSGALLRANTQSPVSISEGDEGSVRIILPVSSMTCDACAVRVRASLEKVPGVKSADVSYEKGEAEVVYDPAVTNADSIRNAIDATGYISGEVIADTTQSQQDKPATAVIGVDGMTCGSCATAVQLALGKVKGVISAEVNFERKEAKIVYDPQLVTLNEIKAAINATGFKAVDRQTSKRNGPNSNESVGTDDPKLASRKVTVAELRSIDPLRELFQRDSGKVRLIALLSPT